MTTNATNRAPRRAGKRAETGNDEPPLASNPTTEEAEIVEDAGALQLHESLISPEPDLSTEPDPFSPVWRVLLFRNEVLGRVRRWKQVAEYADEPFGVWQTDPPVERVLREHGPGEYRFNVKLGNDYLRADAFPAIGGARTFYVLDPAATTPTTPGGGIPTTHATHPAPAPTSANPLGLDLNQLLARLLDSKTAQAPAAHGGGLTIEQAATLIRTAEVAQETKGKLERLTDSLAEKREAALAAKLADERVLGEIRQLIERLSARVEKIEKRDPVAELTKFEEQAKAAGFERTGWVGIAEKALDAVVTRGGVGALGGAPGALGAAAVPQLPGPAPAAGAPSAAPPAGGDWRTLDGGAWLNLGEWAEWVAMKVRRRHPTSTVLMADEAVSRLLNDPNGAAWLKAATDVDLFELFRMVVPADELAGWADLRGEAAEILRLFPQRYDESVRLLEGLKAARQPGAAAAPAAAAASPGRALPPRTSPPPPPPPPPRTVTVGPDGVTVEGSIPPPPPPPR
jgi:hypothetical protein